MDDDTDVKQIYQIKISGRLDQRWIDWFDGMQISTEMTAKGNPITVLTGPVIDQVALRGLLTKIWDLNMELIAVQKKKIAATQLGGRSDETND